MHKDLSGGYGAPYIMQEYETNTRIKINKNSKRKVDLDRNKFSHFLEFAKKINKKIKIKGDVRMRTYLEDNRLITKFSGLHIFVSYRSIGTRLNLLLQ